MEFMVIQMLPTILPLIIGMVIEPIMRQIKRVAPFIDGQGPAVQRLLLGGVAWGMTELSTFLNVALPEDISMVTNTEVTTMVSAGIAMAIHAGNKAKKAS